MPDNNGIENCGITPKGANRELVIPAEMASRGLELAIKIERQQGVEKYNKPVLKFPGFLSRSCINFSKNGEFAAITNQGRQKDNPGLLVWNMVTLVLSMFPQAGLQIAPPDNPAIKRIVFGGQVHFPDETSPISKVQISQTNERYNLIGDITSVALSKCGNIAMIGYGDGSISTCVIKDGVIENFMVIRKDPSGQEVGAIAISPDNYVFAEAAGSIVRLWEMKSGREIWCLEGHNRFYNQLSFSDDGSKLLIANCKRLHDMPACMALMDVHVKNPHLSFVNDQSGNISAVAISSDNHRLVSYNKGIIAVWDAANGRTISQWRHTDEDVNDIIKSYSAGDHAEIPYCDEYDIEMRNHQTPPLVLRNPYIWGLSSVAISPDGKRILSGGGDNFMRLWTLDGHELCEFPHESRVVKVAFHPDGHKVLAGCWNGSVYVWELPQKSTFTQQWSPDHAEI